MRLTYLDRKTYRAKDTPEVLRALRRQWGEFYLLPEGGSNELAVRGCAELPGELETPFDVICCPCGTGGTLAGIAAALTPGRQAMGFSALKGGQFLTDEVERLQRRAFGDSTGNWRIECGFHFGGFAKKTPPLDTFIADFSARHQITLDWVYVAKMMFGVFSLAQSGAFPPGGPNRRRHHRLMPGRSRAQVVVTDHPRCCGLHPGQLPLPAFTSKFLPKPSHLPLITRPMGLTMSCNVPWFAGSTRGRAETRPERVHAVAVPR